MGDLPVHWRGMSVPYAFLRLSQNEKGRGVYALGLDRVSPHRGDARPRLSPSCRPHARQVI
jgi:hypothetical protein